MSRFLWFSVYSSLSRNVSQWHACTTPEYASVRALLLVAATTRHNQSPTDDGQCDFAAIMAAITTNRAPVRGVGRRASERAVLCCVLNTRPDDVAPVCLEANAQCPFDDPATRLERLDERETACHRKVRNSVSLTAAIVPPAAAAADADVGVASGVRGSHDPSGPPIHGIFDQGQN